MRSITKLRIAVGVLVVLLLLPTAVAGVLHTDLTTSTDANQTIATTKEVTFVTAQGKEFSSDDARLVAYNENETPLRVYDKYTRYYDVDPLEGDRILFIAAAKGVSESNYTGRFVVVEMNWRTGEIYREFPVPGDTHDVDYLGNDKYAIVEKVNTDPPSESNKAYVYDYASDERIWQYNFTEHFPPYPKAGGKKTGYTHLNDIDAVDNGSAFLVSPRNFDRVMLINRSTKEVEWTLGEENNHTILNEQHNPQLISQDPLTVLVADSENDRIVEYRRNETGWHLDWAYTDLTWPRDADRLPNGNTLIADSGGNRALEITPHGEIVWQVNISYSPYDIERLSLGDEPGGPTVMEMDVNGTYGTSDTGDDDLPATAGRVLDSFEFLYKTAQWIVPTWVGRLEFAFLSMIPLIGTVWAGIELSRVWPGHLIERQKRRFGGQQRGVKTVLAIASLLEGVILLVISIAPSSHTTLVVGFGILTLVEGASAIQTASFNTRSDGSLHLQDVFQLFHSALRVIAVLSAVIFAYLAITVGGTFLDLYIATAFLLALSALRSQ